MSLLQTSLCACLCLIAAVISGTRPNCCTHAAQSVSQLHVWRGLTICIVLLYSCLAAQIVQVSGLTDHTKCCCWLLCSAGTYIAAKDRMDNLLGLNVSSFYWVSVLYTSHVAATLASLVLAAVTAAITCKSANKTPAISSQPLAQGIIRVLRCTCHVWAVTVTAMHASLHACLHVSDQTCMRPCMCVPCRRALTRMD